MLFLTLLHPHIFAISSVRDFLLLLYFAEIRNFSFVAIFVILIFFVPFLFTFPAIHFIIFLYFYFSLDHALFTTSNSFPAFLQLPFYTFLYTYILYFDSLSNLAKLFSYFSLSLFVQNIVKFLETSWKVHTHHTNLYTYVYLTTHNHYSHHHCVCPYNHWLLHYID